MTKLLNLKENDIPKLPRHAKLRFDEASSNLNLACLGNLGISFSFKLSNFVIL